VFLFYISNSLKDSIEESREEESAGDETDALQESSSEKEKQLREYVGQLSALRLKLARKASKNPSWIKDARRVVPRTHLTPREDSPATATTLATSEHATTPEQRSEPNHQPTEQAAPAVVVPTQAPPTTTDTSATVTERKARASDEWWA